MKGFRRKLADGLVRAAAGKMSRRHPDWAEAMRGEHAALSGHKDQLGWAFGALQASLEPRDAFYPAALCVAVSILTLYQWSADESLLTLGLLTGLALVLGALSPQRFVASGVALGAVVCAVNSFETLSGVRPAYEVHHHSWAHDLRWLMLILPALLSSGLGRRVGLKFLTR